MGEKIAYAITLGYDIIGIGAFLAGRVVGNFIRGVDGCYVPIVTNPDISEVVREAEQTIIKERKARSKQSRQCGFTSEWN